MLFHANLLLHVLQSTRVAGKVHISQLLRKIQQKKWKLMLTVMSEVLHVCCKSDFRNRRLVWMLPHSSIWWEDAVLNNFGPHD